MLNNEVEKVSFTKTYLENRNCLVNEDYTYSGGNFIIRWGDCALRLTFRMIETVENLPKFLDYTIDKLKIEAKREIIKEYLETDVKEGVGANFKMEPLLSDRDLFLVTGKTYDELYKFGNVDLYARPRINWREIINDKKN